MIEDCVIIGGGIAGLSAANQLIDAGMKPLIVDGGEYPCHRICGEYFSHESLTSLQKWDIPLNFKINFARFVKGRKEIEFKLPIPASTCSHFECDAMLFDRALKNGSRALCKTTVQSVQLPSNKMETYQLMLSNNQTIKTRHLIIGTGKLPKINGIKSQLPEMKYFGFKAHFEGIEMSDRIEMHLFSGGYLGLANVNANTTNIAALVCKDRIDDWEQPEKLMQKLMVEESMPFLKQRMKNAKMLFPKWLVTSIPEFGIRENPQLERVFWIGDAAGGIPPVSGEGLAIAVTSGCMAADYLLKSDAHQFKMDWLKRYHKRYFWAQTLHKGLIRPWINEVGIRLCQLVPSIPVYAWKLTREKG